MSQPSQQPQPLGSGVKLRPGDAERFYPTPAFDDPYAVARSNYALLDDGQRVYLPRIEASNPSPLAASDNGRVVRDWDSGNEQEYARGPVSINTPLADNSSGNLLMQGVNGFASTVATGLFGGSGPTKVTAEEAANWRPANPNAAFGEGPTVQWKVDLSTGTATRAIGTTQSFTESLKDTFSLGLRPLGQSLGTFFGGLNVAGDESLSPSARSQGAFDAGANSLSVPAAGLTVGSPLLKFGGNSGIDAGIRWGGGIQAQGMPWENYLSAQLPAGSRLPAGFKTFDLFGDVSGTAISAKTLDTTTTAKLAKPEQIFTSLKANIDAAANFESYTLKGVSLSSGDIATRQIQVAVPRATTDVQWQQIQRAIQYGQSNNVQVVVTPTR